MAVRPLFMTFSIGVVLLFVVRAAAQQPMAQATLTQAEETKLLDLVRNGWKARTGETATQVVSGTAKVAHFIPREWYGWVSRDGKERGVGLSWVKQRTDKKEDAYSIQWTVNADGSIVLGPPYAKTMELGTAAFALSLIQAEVNDKIRGPNLRYLRDLRNLNFVDTPQGKLGDLLSKGQCSLRDPTSVEYGTMGRKTDRRGFHVQLSVDCHISGPAYFTRDGVIRFQMEDGAASWRPFSFFALRLTKYPPGTWLVVEDATEQKAMALVMTRALHNGMSAADATTMMKAAELRNDGDTFRY